MGISKRRSDGGRVPGWGLRDAVAYVALLLKLPLITKNVI
jgi:hypothetical protein